MPQRELWAQQHAVSVRWEYTWSPLDPSADAVLHVHVLDQSGALMESASATVSSLVTFEGVAGILAASWEAWLFGERGALLRAVQHERQKWSREARIRAKSSGAS